MLYQIMTKTGGHPMRNIILITLIFLCSIVFGQEEPKTSIAGGAKALLFEFDGLSYLSAGSYEGGIGAKMFFNNKLGLRVVFNYDRLSETEPANPVGDDGHKDGEFVSTSFGLGAGIEYHLRSKARVSPYIGGGVGFSVISSEDKAPDTWGPGGDSYRLIVKRTGGYNFDMMGILGAELFLIKEVSLSAEYIFGIGFYSDGDVKNTYVVTAGDPGFVPASSTVKGDSGWLIGSGSRGQLILSIYF